MGEVYENSRYYLLAIFCKPKIVLTPSLKIFLRKMFMGFYKREDEQTRQDLDAI